MLLTNPEIFGLISVYFAIGVLYSGDEWYEGTLQNLYLDATPIWPSFLGKTFFWPIYWLGLFGICLLCLGAVIFIKIHTLLLEVKDAQV